jgi:geranylgeranyl diphosphate synthase type 3
VTTTHRIKHRCTILIFELLNDTIVQYTDSKGFCEDLSEGKFSFPVIHSVRASPNDRQLLEILKQKPQSIELKQYALKLMEATNTFDYTKQYLRDLFIDIQEEVGKFGNNPVLDKILVQLDVQD